ncbi:MAG: hypothetical protein AAGI66_04425 [Cyanobacteria bacterium P01_H01_bin.74]
MLVAPELKNQFFFSRLLGLRHLDFLLLWVVQVLGLQDLDVYMSGLPYFVFVLLLLQILDFVLLWVVRVLGLRDLGFALLVLDLRDLGLAFAHFQLGSGALNRSSEK